MSDKEIMISPLLTYFEGLGYSSEIVREKKLIKNFGNENEELNSLYSGVGLRDISWKGIIELKGTDVLDYLHRITTNNLKELQREKLAHTIFTSEKGRIIDIGTLLNFEDYQLLVCNAGYKTMVKRWIDKYTITDDVKTTDNPGKYVILELLGKQANSYLMFVCGSIIDNINQDSFKVVNAENMLFFVARIKERNNTEKFWLIADPENGRKLVQYMIDNQGPFDFNLVGENSYNIYRVEQGIPAAPGELNDSVNPHEVKMLDLIDFKKGCYIGQEVIARLDTYEKVKSYIMGIKFYETPDPAESYSLIDDEQSDAGRVTSIVYSPRCKKDIGLAFVKKAFAEEGRELKAIDTKGKTISVTVNNLPFRK